MRPLRRLDRSLHRHAVLVVAAVLLLGAGIELYGRAATRAVRAQQVQECQAQLEHGWCSFNVGMTFGPPVLAILAVATGAALLLWWADLTLRRRAPKASVALRLALALLVGAVGVGMVRDLLGPGEYTCVASDCYHFRPPLSVAVLAWGLALAFLACAANLLPFRARRGESRALKLSAEGEI